jgi:hypothetical protein
MSLDLAPAADATDISSDDTPDAVLAPLYRNPTVPVHDHSTGPVARSFKAHRAFAEDLAADLSGGSMLTVVQPAKKGFWVTEWTVLSGKEPGERLARRRAALARTLPDAVSQFSTLGSFHNSHYFRPEEGIRGWWKRP